MTDILPFLKKLISAPGLSGHEGPVCTLIEQAWQDLTDELHVSRLGSLHGLKKGTAPQPRPSMLIATHMDAVGMMVSQVIDGFLRITEIGGLDPRVLPGQLVTVHASAGGEKPDELPGVIVQPPSYLLPDDVDSGVVPLQYLLVDTGLSQQEVARKVGVGDLVSFAQKPIEMGGQVIAGHTLDNRSSVAALTLCLEELRNRSHAWDIWAVATVQEEETMGGALTSGFEINPNLAVAVDVTFARGPGTPEHESYPLEKGFTLGWGPNIHPGLHKSFKEVAERLELPYTVEPLPRNSGTDAYGLQIAREGIATMVVSIPLRYMHTPVEVVSVKDIQRVGRLLAEFSSTLPLDYMESLKSALQ
jgi:endoglucanase